MLAAFFFPSTLKEESGEPARPHAPRPASLSGGSKGEGAKDGGSELGGRRGRGRGRWREGRKDAERYRAREGGNVGSRVESYGELKA